ncbi:enoyl-CoA hydratase-related protein [Alkaliphilus serpentinus]|uniref:short-chain-enoyl-CoA hydratase n=1 Tax=Alkaliphilus serpentinus TaxID=1482731 RepID=A0A833M8L1_9FIRM|nr:enoyl-CoA hydratase-related protein [Alkaliphilus serpentinus]KAB3533216.1 crotonase [Alkaliphilus serpentinus]
MEYQTIKYEVLDDQIGILTLNRSNVLNSINNDMLMELGGFLDTVLKDSIKVLIITGEGKAFAAGADIEAMSIMTSEEARVFAKEGQDIFSRIENLDIPVIAAVNGFALGGGCELAMACDIRIASEKAKFGQPEVGLGTTPGFAGTQRLPQIVGIAKAKELIFTGEIIGAKEAFEIGLVNKVCQPEELMITAIEMAKKVAGNSGVAIKYSKIAINNGYSMNMENGNLLEGNLFALSFAHEDQREGMKAFLEKRKPQFK